jgi:isoamylase
MTPAGEEMTPADWNAGYAKSLAVYLNGDAISEPDPRGEPISDDRFLLLFNVGSDPITFTLPPAELAPGWDVVVDTTMAGTGASLQPRSDLKVASRAVVVLRSKG